MRLILPLCLLVTQFVVVFAVRLSRKKKQQWPASLSKPPCFSNLSDGDVMLLAEVQGSAGLAGLDEQLHPPLLLPPLQEEVSCIAVPEVLWYPFS